MGYFGGSEFSGGPLNGFSPFASGIHYRKKLPSSFGVLVLRIKALQFRVSFIFLFCFMIQGSVFDAGFGLWGPKVIPEANPSPPPASPPLAKAQLAEHIPATQNHPPTESPKSQHSERAGLRAYLNPSVE